MKKRSIILLFFTTLFIGFFFQTQFVVAEEVESEFSTVVEEQIDAIDGEELDKLLQSLTEEQRKIFGGKDWKELIKNIAKGEFSIQFSDLGNLIVYTLKNNFTKFLSLAATIIAIAIITSIINATKSDFLNQGIGNIVFYAGYGLILTLVIVCVAESVRSSIETITGFQGQMATFIPIMLVLLGGAGGEFSASVFSPICAFLSTGVIGVFLQIAIPILYALISLCVFGNLSTSIKTKSLFSLFGNVVKWIIGTSLAVYSLVVGLQGVSSGIHDGISYKLLKYTVGNSIPIVGGTIKEGVDILLASSITVKNAVGYFAILLLLGSAIGSVLQILALSWVIKASASVLQPLGEDRICNFLGEISSVLQYIIAIVAASAFLYVITIFALIGASSSLL